MSFQGTDALALSLASPDRKMSEVVCPTYSNELTIMGSDEDPNEVLLLPEIHRTLCILHRKNRIPLLVDVQYQWSWLCLGGSLLGDVLIIISDNICLICRKSQMLHEISH